MVEVAVLATESLNLKEFQIAQTPSHQRRKETTKELALVRNVAFEKTEMTFDSTGMFHWVPAQTIEDCTLVRQGGGNYFMLFAFRIESIRRVSSLATWWFVYLPTLTARWSG